MKNTTIIVKPSYSTYVKYKGKYLQEINEMLRDLGTVETPEVAMPSGAGVTLVEVIAIYIVADFTKELISEIAKKTADKFIEWITDRNNKGKGPIQKTHVTIYGPDGLPLKTVECDNKGNVKES